MADGSAAALLGVGVGLSLVLGALIFVLATGRLRALTLVGQKAAELRHQEMHDPLTGLPNRALTMDRFEQMIARNHRNGTLASVLYIDLDGFKNVNDALGHGVGDRLLQAVGARLTSSLRDTDTIGRMGGDEFVVLIDGATLHSAPELVAERALEVIRQPYEIDGASTPITITASVGIAAGQHKSPDDLLREADMALYRAKAIGRNCFESFHPEADADLTRRYELEFDLRSALELDQLRLVYQPIYNLEDLAPVSTEALLRWTHPMLGNVTPDEFIPLHGGQRPDHRGRSVGARARLPADRGVAPPRSRAARLRERVRPPARSRLHRRRRAARARDQRPRPDRADPRGHRDHADAQHRRDRAAAARPQGAGHPDRDRRLRHRLLQPGLPATVPGRLLKIDRTFTDAITHPSDREVLIQTLVQLGKNLGLTTLAEGVETTVQMDYLRSLGVDMVQGFLLARPLEVGDLERHVNRLARPAALAP